MLGLQQDNSFNVKFNNCFSSIVKKYLVKTLWGFQGFAFLAIYIYLMSAFNK
jgi:hypothetical protein